MADRGRSRLATALLLAAAPLLVLGGLWATTTGPGDVRRSEPSAAASERVAPSVPVPRPAAPRTDATSAARVGVRPDTVVVPALDVRAAVTPIATRGGAREPTA